MSEKEKRKSYDIGFKLEAVDYSKQNSKEAAARHYGVDPKRIREWCKQEDNLRKLNESSTKDKKRKRLNGAGDKIFSEELEDLVMAWIEDQRSKKLKVSRRLIMQKAKELADSPAYQYQSNKPFSASNGWLRRFMTRHQISMRKITTTAQTPPEQLTPKNMEYITNKPPTDPFEESDQEETPVKEEKEDEEESLAFPVAPPDSPLTDQHSHDRIPSAAVGSLENTHDGYDDPMIKEEPPDDDITRDTVPLFSEHQSVFNNSQTAYEDTRLERFQDHDVFITNKDNYGRMVFQLSQPGNLLLMSIQSLRRDGLLTDVTLVANNGRVNAHQIVLSAYSKKFLAALKNRHRSDDPNVTVMVPTGLSVVTTVLDFLYEGIIKISDENFEDLKQAAECLGIELLVEYCHVYRLEKYGEQSQMLNLSDATSASNRKRKLDEPATAIGEVTGSGVPDLLHDIKEEEEEDVPNPKKSNSLTGASSSLDFEPSSSSLKSEIHPLAAACPSSSSPAVTESAPVPVMLTQNMFGTLTAQSVTPLNLVATESSKIVPTPIIIEPTVSSSLQQTSTGTTSNNSNQSVRSSNNKTVSVSSVPLGSVDSPVGSPTYTVVPQGILPRVTNVSTNPVILGSVPAYDSQGNRNRFILLTPSTQTANSRNNMVTVQSPNQTVPSSAANETQVPVSSSGDKT